MCGGVLKGSGRRLMGDPEGASLISLSRPASVTNVRSQLSTVVVIYVETGTRNMQAKLEVVDSQGNDAR